ncbi:MAG: short-chain dehydrogenase [Myxococcales bacterium]|nr:short-chain dehydrogenase [Myxococcales bacterium]
MQPLLKNRTIMITGASSGIGEAYVRELGSVANTLVLVARRTERLEQIADEVKTKNPELRVSIQTCDLQHREAIDSMLTSVKEDVGTIDVLINNAGFGDICLVENADWEKLERMVAVNINAVCYLTRRLVPEMVAQGHGGVMNVGSYLGLSTMPAFSMYTGTKHFITGFTESLRAELRGTGVAVTLVCPGPVDTEFKAAAALPSYAKPPGWLEISARTCARSSLRGFRWRRPLAIPGLIPKVLFNLFLIFPRPVHRVVNGFMGRFVRKNQNRLLGQSGLENTDQNQGS